MREWPSGFTLAVIGIAATVVAGACIYFDAPKRVRKLRADILAWRAGKMDGNQDGRLSGRMEENQGK